MLTILRSIFSTGTGLERVGIARPELAMLLGRSAGSGCENGTPLPLDVGLLCLWMWDSSATPMPKSVPL